MTNGVNKTEERLKKLRRQTSPETDKRILTEATAQFERAAKVRVSSRWQVFVAAAAVLAIVMAAGILTLKTESKKPRPDVTQKFSQSESVTEIQKQQNVPAGLTPTAVDTGEKIQRMMIEKEPVQTRNMQDKFLQVARYAAAGDVNSLLKALASNDAVSRIAAARYLSEMPDERAVAAIDKLAERLDANEPQDYLLAAAIGLEGFSKEMSEQKIEEVNETAPAGSKITEANEPNILRITEEADGNDMNEPGLYPRADQNETQAVGECALFGYIFDVNEEPLYPADIQINAGGKKFINNTDNEGWYEIKGLPAEVRFKVMVFAEGFGNNSFDYTCTDPNVRLDVQIYPPGYEWYGIEAPPLYIAEWLNFDPGSLDSLRGKVVVLCFGEKLEEEENLLEELNDLTNEYDSNELEVIAIRSRQDFGEDKGARIQQVLEESAVDFAFGVDAEPSVAADMVLPESTVLENNQVTILRKGMSQAGATYSVYDVRWGGAFYIIDRQGILLGCFGIEELRNKIESLLALP